MLSKIKGFQKNNCPLYLGLLEELILEELFCGGSLVGVFPQTLIDHLTEELAVVFVLFLVVYTGVQGWGVIL